MCSFLPHRLSNSTHPFNLWFWSIKPRTPQNAPYRSSPPEVSREILLSSSAGFMSWCDLPGEPETPAKELGQTAAETQDTWVKTVRKMEIE